METKTCKECGRELPVTEFLMTRWGHYSEVCKKCINDKKIDTRSRKVIGGDKILLSQTLSLTGSCLLRYCS